MKAGATMQTAVQRYLHERRQLGFELASPAHDLMRFARFADARGHHGPLTQELQIDWAQQHVRRSSSGTAAWRLQILRPFAAYYRQFETDSEVLAPSLLGRRSPRPTPHIYTEKEILDLMDHASRLPPLGGLRPLTYRTLFGLLAAAGLRLSEALKLLVGDVDLQYGTITVRATKFKKSRCLPLHASVVQALAAYRQVRDRHADPGIGAPSSSRTPAAGCRRERCMTCSAACGGTLVGAPAGTTPNRASMTCGTRWPSVACNSGTSRAHRSIMRCSGSALTSATPRSPAPTSRRWCSSSSSTTCCSSAG